jgi:hypothetical protein
MHKMYVIFRNRPATSSKALKLGAKSKDVDSFVDQLKSEGEHVMSEASVKRTPQIVKASVAAPVRTER